MATAVSNLDSDYPDVTELVALLVNRPQEVVDQLSQLRDEFYRDCQHTHSEYLKLVSDLFHALMPANIANGQDLLPALHAGLLELLADTIANDRFFLEEKVVQDFHVWPLALLVIRIAKELLLVAGKRTLQTASSLFKSIWDHRRLVQLSGHGGSKKLSTGHESTDPLADLLNGYLNLHRIFNNGAAPLDPCICYVHILLWVLSCEEEGVAPVTLSDYIEPCFFDPPASWNAYSQPPLEDRDVSVRGVPHCDTIVQQCIMDGIGVDRFLSCYEVQLHRLATGQRGPAEYTHAVGNLFALFGSQLLTPALARRTTLACGIEAMKVMLAAGAEKASPALAWCFRVYDDTDVYLRNQALAGSIDAFFRMPSLRPETVDIFACAVQIAAASGARLSTIMPERTLVVLNQHLAKWISDHKGDRHSQSTPMSVAKLAKDARPQWWPALRKLQAACQTPHVTDDLSNLLTLWSMFGTVLGLDAKKERLRHERDARLHCSWVDCTYHAEVEPAALLVCKGCGDARYCGRDCQKLDWKRGGHKQACRRLK